MFLEGAVDEAVVAAGALHEYALAHGFEEGDEAEGEEVVESEEEAEDVMFENRRNTVKPTPLQHTENYSYGHPHKT